MFYRVLLQNTARRRSLPKFSHSLLEAAGPVGVADILTLEIKNNANLEELSQRFHGISKSSSAFILSQLRQNNKPKLSSIFAGGSVSAKSTAAALRQLVSANIVAPASKDRIKLAPKVAVPDGTLCYYELKLKNWRRAIFQSAQALSYCDYAYCVMPVSAKKLLIGKKKIFRENGIGLITFDPATENYEVLVRAAKRGPKRQAAKIEMMLRYADLAFPAIAPQLTRFQKFWRFIGFGKSATKRSL